MAKRRRKNSRVNPVREWISDNLRYLLLILIVVIAALVAFLVYRGLANRSRSAAELTSTSVSSSTNTSSGAVSTTTVSKSEETESESKTDVVTATPTPTETPTPTPTPTPEPTPAVELTEDSPEVLTVVQNYFYQLQVDGQSEIIEYYDNIHVQTVPGPEEDTYVAYADYDYKYWNYDSVIPGLTEFYLQRGEDGYLQTVDTIPDDVQDFITEVRQTDDIQEIISSVQTRYDQVLSEDPELAAYLSGQT